VGAVVVYQGQPIAKGYNRVIADHDPSAHAEIVALRAAGQFLGNYRLQECQLYVSLEPCAMCAGAIAHARIQRVVYGAAEPRAGAAGSVLDVLQASGISHRPQALCAQTAAGADPALLRQLAALLPDFFQTKRREQAKASSPLHPAAVRTADTCFASLDSTNQPVSFYCHDLPALAGLRMHFWDSGDCSSAFAQALTTSVDLCLHDGDGWSQDFAEYYAAQCAVQRILVPDLPGFGRSDKWKKRTAYSAQSWLEVLAQWLHQRVPQALAQGQLRIVVPSPAHPLLPLLMQALPAQHRPPVHLAPRTAHRPWQQLPYPDAGHKAGLLAWRHIF
jgi:tRNA(adenine34) deaminase